MRKTVELLLVVVMLIQFKITVYILKSTVSGFALKVRIFLLEKMQTWAQIWGRDIWNTDHWLGKEGMNEGKGKNVP